MAEQERLTTAEYRQLLALQEGPRPKYKNRRQRVDGIFFDSGAEVTRYCELRLLEKAGEISGLTPSPEHPKKKRYEFIKDGKPLVIRSARYPNGRRVKYTPDFVYRDRRGRVVVEDVKGNSAVTNLSDSKIRIALMELFHGIKVKVVERGPKSRRQAKGQGDNSVRVETDSE